MSAGITRNGPITDLSFLRPFNWLRSQKKDAWIIILKWQCHLTKENKRSFKRHTNDSLSCWRRFSYSQATSHPHTLAGEKNISSFLCTWSWTETEFVKTLMKSTQMEDFRKYKWTKLRGARNIYKWKTQKEVFTNGPLSHLGFAQVGTQAGKKS